MPGFPYLAPGGICRMNGAMVVVYVWVTLLDFE